MRAQRQVLIGWGLTLCLVAACGRQDSNDSRTKVVIGDDTRQTVKPGQSELPPVLQRSLGALARIRQTCTAFHIGGGLVATAAHCVDKQRAETRQSCHRLQLTWHNGQRAQCLGYVDYALDDARDYVVMQFDPYPKVALPLARAARQAEVQPTVVGYPQSQGLSWSQPCQYFRWSSAATFYHDCDTEPGNSGSPVIDLATGEVLGVHNGFAQDEGVNYGSELPLVNHGSEAVSGEIKLAQLVSEERQFGPFGDNDYRTLMILPTRVGKRVSFRLRYDLEQGFDQAVIASGGVALQEFTGSGETVLTLSTPVVIAIETDYSGSSQLLAVDQLSVD